jgi:hypothetical protein
MEQRVASSIKPVGRINFVLRTLVVTATAFALEFLVDELLHLTLLLRYSYALQRLTIFGVAGFFLLAVIDGRLLDAGLPHWCRYPAYLVWLLSTSLPVIWPTEGRIGVALFVLLMIVGCSIPGKPVSVKYVAMGGIAQPGEKASAPLRKYRSRWFVTPIGFLRSLLTIACFWLPLIWLEDASGQRAGIWIARFGYLILSIVWFYIILGRLDDAGRLPRARYGYLLICFVLLLRIMLRRFGSAGSTTGWQALLLSNVASTASRLSPWMQLINGYERFALFLLIQIPFAFLPSKPKPPELLAEIHRREVDLKKRVPVAKTNELALCGPLEYLRIVFVIALLFTPLIYLDDAFCGTVGSWMARLGYLVLIFFWLAFANGRLEDAGWAHSQYPAQFGFVVSVAWLMPLAFHWVNGYGALAIFVLIQTPTALLRSKPAPEEPVPESGG